MARSRRTITPDMTEPVPRHVVWELTMKCNHACAHCGSRAAEPRDNELDTPELLEVADQLAAAGTTEVALIGGEAFLHPGMVPVTRRLTDHGIRVILQTGGRGLGRTRLRTLKDAGLVQVGVSIDGLEPTHDLVRASTGSFAAAVRTLVQARELGFITTVNTQIHRLSAGELRPLAAQLHALGVRGWRCQLTAPMGRAADRPEWILQPWEIIDVIDTLGELQIAYAEDAAARGLGPRHIFDVRISNNLGYYGPYDVLLRSEPGQDVCTWGGCQAGMHVFSVESDGTMKACPSLPTEPYRAPDIREVPLAEAWETHPALSFTRHSRESELWGFCKTCMYAPACQGGCSFTAHTLLGRRGNFPQCYWRATQLKKRGRRERLVHVTPAGGAPYDFGRFEVIEEDWPTEG